MECMAEARVARVLEIMADMGGARRTEDGYFLPR